MTSLSARKYRVVFKPVLANMVCTCMQCETEFEPGDVAKLCSKCKATAYCSNDCLQAGQESHSKWCENYQDTKQWHSSFAAKQLARKVRHLNRDQIESLRMIILLTTKDGEFVTLKACTDREMSDWTGMTKEQLSKDAFAQTVNATKPYIETTPTYQCILFAEFCGDDFRMSPVYIVHKDTCSQCHEKAPDGELWKMCAGCKSKIYCGDECARAGWPEHKKICKDIKPK